MIFTGATGCILAAAPAAARIAAGLDAGRDWSWDSSRRRRGFRWAFRPTASLSGGILLAGGVHYFADELFEDVFEGNQASCLAVLVDQASEV
jgi:hypothetical protein